MPLYSYTGRSSRGEPASGVIDAESRSAVATRLLAGGVTPVTIAPASAAGSGDVLRALRVLGIGVPTTKDLVLFSRQMYTITKSGIPLLRGIKGLAASTHNAMLRETLESVVRDLEGGRTLAGSFARYPQLFPALYASMVRVGEETGTLEASFKRLAEYLHQDQDMRDRIKAATRYPIIVLCTVAIAVAVLTAFVIPKFAPLFRALGDDIPVPTRLLMGVSHVAQHYWMPLVGGVLLLAIAMRQYVRTTEGRFRWDKLKLRIPALGTVIREGTLARVTRSLAISLGAGMPVVQTLKIIAKAAGNEFMAERVERMREGVERGDPLSQAAASVGLFPPLVVQMLTVGEETGELSHLLDEIADYYEREVDYKLKGLSGAIEPVLVVVVGAIVCVLALGVMLPMWEMISKVGGG